MCGQRQLQVLRTKEKRWPMYIDLLGQKHWTAQEVPEDLGWPESSPPGVIHQSLKDVCQSASGQAFVIHMCGVCVCVCACAWVCSL